MEPLPDNNDSTATNSTTMASPHQTDKNNIVTHPKPPTTNNTDRSGISQAIEDPLRVTQDISAADPPASTDTTAIDGDPWAKRGNAEFLKQQAKDATRAIEQLRKTPLPPGPINPVQQAEQRKLLEQLMGDQLLSQEPPLPPPSINPVKTEQLTSLSDAIQSPLPSDLLEQLMDDPSLSAPTKELYASHLDPDGAALHRLAVENAPPQLDVAEVIRQVEYYFSDENLPTDAHLLSFTGANGTGWVSLNRIFGFKKMRGFKPPAMAKAALKQSTFLEIDDKNKHVRRRIPLKVPVQHIPVESLESKRAKVLIEKPWLSKALLKPTGFEANFTEGPMRPEEYAVERKLYDPDEAFTIRIDYAIAKYLAKRKMHQQTLKIFSKFLLFGGFSGSPRQFTGGFGDKDLEDYDKDEILQMKAVFGVADHVYDGLQPDSQTWTVDFEGIAKSFFSSQLLQHFDWKDPDVSSEATNILRNFYNYLLYHDVCPEYQQDILNAKVVCDLAEEELPRLATAERSLPGDFNTACSTLFGGYYASRRPSNPNAEWVHPEDDQGWSDDDARAVFHTATLAHLSSSQLKAFQCEDLAVHSYREVGLEVIGIQFADGRAKGIYESDGLKESFVRSTGKLRCKRWVVPGAPRLDLPDEEVERREGEVAKEYSFLIEDEVLEMCYVGLRMEVVVGVVGSGGGLVGAGGGLVGSGGGLVGAEGAKVGGGVWFIDQVLFVYPSFFTWTKNEYVKEGLMAEGGPKEWMRRQNERHSEGIEGAGGEDDLEVGRIEGVEGDVGGEDGGQAGVEGEGGDGVEAKVGDGVVEGGKGEDEGEVGGEAVAAADAVEREVEGEDAAAADETPS